MKRAITIGLMALCGAAAASGVSSAATVDQRERHQQRRIYQGIESGQLTPRELARLEAQEARIRREEYRYRHNDGHLGPRERADLQRDLNRESGRIYAEQHDGQQR